MLRKCYVQEDWSKNVIKDYLYTIIAFDFGWFLIVAEGSAKWVVFRFLDILDKKGMDAIFKQMGKK